MRTMFFNANRPILGNNPTWLAYNRLYKGNNLVWGYNIQSIANL